MSDTQHTATTVRQFTGWHMLITICSFFGVVIAVNVTMAVFATQSWTGLVVRNSYVASQEFNDVLDEARQQDALGWHDSLDRTADGITFTLAGTDDTPLTGLQVTAMLRRPVHEGDDREVALIESAAGTYQGAVALAPGIWTVDVSVSGAARDYRRIYRIAVPQEAVQ